MTTFEEEFNAKFPEYNDTIYGKITDAFKNWHSDEEFQELYGKYAKKCSEVEFGLSDISKLKSEIEKLKQGTISKDELVKILIASRVEDDGLYHISPKQVLDKIENVSVISAEQPKVKVKRIVADWIKARENSKQQYEALYGEGSFFESLKDNHNVRDWVQKNFVKFMLAWIYGCEVEDDEPRYYVKILVGKANYDVYIDKDENMTDYRGRYAFTKSELAEIMDGALYQRIPEDDIDKTGGINGWQHCTEPGFENYVERFNPAFEFVEVE